MGIDRDELDSSEAAKEWAAQLTAYVDGQGDLLVPLRHRSMPAAPWPELDNPMVGYLIDRAVELTNDAPLVEVLAWLAAHTWFESALDERARLLRTLTS